MYISPLHTTTISSYASEKINGWSPFEDWSKIAKRWNPTIALIVLFNVKFLKTELLSRYEKANWVIDWHIDDGLDGPNMSGGDYLVLKGKK